MSGEWGKDQSEAELQRLRAALEASGDITYSWDLTSDRITWGGRHTALFSKDEVPPLCGDAFNNRVNPEDLPLRLRALSRHFSEAGNYDCEYRIRGTDGEFEWLHDRGKLVRSANGAPLRFSGMLRPITERKRQEANLRQEASFDDLTGHFNKLRLREALDQSMAQSLRISGSGAFVVVGIDQMDKINTAYGHEFGNRALVEIGHLLDSCMRAADVIGRLGGDCFGMILNDCDYADAEHAAERILNLLRRTPIDCDGQIVHVTASIGVAIFPTHSRTSTDIMTKAEGALLQAKMLGRDCASIYRMSDQQRRDHRERMDIGERVKLALKEERLSLAYQPIVDAHSGQTRLYECLLRMRTREGQILPAGLFVPVVEQLGLMRAIDRRVLELAVNELERYPDIVLAFNISGLTALERSWLRALVARLSDKPSVARRLVVEITETAALHDVEETARFVTAVRELGCRVAVDDFGAGYTTFQHLRSLTVDIVKIDGSFVRDITKSHENQLFLNNLLGLARALNLETVAECVETKEDADYLSGLGVDLLQGYYFGKPTLHPEWQTAPALKKSG